jgi:hypothetical protein
VKITCNKHKVFEQKPNAHLVGKGCPACGIKRSSDIKRSTREEFIKKAQDIHKDQYENPLYGYDEVEYINCHIKVKITCNKHGVFEQEPSSHLASNGCPFCGGTKRLTIEEFIKKAQDIHKDQDGNPLYGYDKVKYINIDTNIIITCNKHGNFKQIPYNHLKGCGCSKCNNAGYSKACISFLKKIPYTIIHFENEGEKLLKVKNKKYKADGYYKAQNDKDVDNLFKHFQGCFKFRNNKSLEVVIEYHGCYWHGCEDCFLNREELNKTANKTYEELYNRTIEKRLNVIKAGYNYIEIWEHQTKDFY